MRRLTSLVTKIVGSSFEKSRTSSATIRIRWSAIWLSRNVVGTDRAADATRTRPPPSGSGIPSDRRPFARRVSSIRATSRALRPRSDASFLKVSTSSRTKIGMTTSLSANWRIARGSWRRTFVSKTKCFMRARSLGRLFGLLGFAARDRHLLDDDVALRFVARTTLDAGHLGDQRGGLAQAEDGVAARQVLGRPLGDEELRTIRPRSGVRHREQARLVELQLGRELVLEAITGVAGADAQGIAALDHESGDHAVEDQTIVKRLLLDPLAGLRVLPGTRATRQPDEVGDRDRRLLFVELAVERAERRLDLGVQRTGAPEALRRLLERELPLRGIVVVGANGA